MLVHHLGLQLLTAISVNKGGTTDLVISGDVLARSLYENLRVLDGFHEDRAPEPAVKAVFREAARQYFNEFLAKLGTYIKIDGLSESRTTQLGKSIPLDRTFMVDILSEEIPICQTYGMLESDLGEIENDIKEGLMLEDNTISKGKRLFDDIFSIIKSLDFESAENSNAGALARTAVRAAYKHLFLRQLVRDSVEELGLQLDAKHIEQLVPALNIKKRIDVWPYFDNEIKPRLVAIEEFNQLAESAGRTNEQLLPIISDYLKRGRIAVPEWFLEKHGLKLKVVDSREVLGEDNLEVVATRLHQNRQQKEHLLNRLESLPFFKDLPAEEVRRAFRILSRFDTDVLEAAFETLSAKDNLDSNQLNEFLRGLGFTYSANPITAEAAVTGEQAESILPDAEPFKLDYSALSKELNFLPESFVENMQLYFESRKHISTLQGAKVKTIPDSKAYEYKDGSKYRVYFLMEDHTLKFIKAGDKDSQDRDIADLRKIYPK